jgi:hemoglobin
MRCVLSVAFLCVVLLPASPGGDKQNTMYERLGGEKGIAQIVDDLVANVLVNPKYSKEHKEHFMKGDVPALKRKLIDQIGEATGGPQKYKGKNMKDAHKGLKITNADFNALMEDVTKALVKNKVEPKDLRVLIKVLQKMRPDVVEVPDKSSLLPGPALERAPLGS